MANDPLATTGTSQSQTTAQGTSLQPTGQAAGSGTLSASVQPGTATSLLSSGPSGVPLHGASLSTVNLNRSAPVASTAAPSKTVASSHHVNPALLALPAILVLIAVALFWATSRSVKTTT